MTKMLLPCSVSPGQFPTEYAISGTQFNGKSYSLFAPVETVTAPPSAEEGDGYLQVELVDRKGDMALVRLPAQTFENGQYITVSFQILQPLSSHKVGA